MGNGASEIICKPGSQFCGHIKEHFSIDNFAVYLLKASISISYPDNIVYKITTQR